MKLISLSFDLYYPSIITLLFLGVYLFVRFKINAVESKRLKSIKKRNILDPVETESPEDDQEADLKKVGISGTEDRFTFIKRALPIILFPVWMFVIFVPYLGKIPSVYISIVAAILSVVVGLALRPFLENLFSGVVITFFRSIKVGDTVRIDGHYGLIEEIGLTYAVLKRWDWNRIMIPNSKLLQKEIENLTFNDAYIWSYIEFWVSPDSDIARVEEISKEVASQASYFNGSEEPSFWVMGLEKDAIKCWLAAWADTPSDAWELRHEMRTNVMKRLQSEGFKFQKFTIQS